MSIYAISHKLHPLKLFKLIIQIQNMIVGNTDAQMSED